MLSGKLARPHPLNTCMSFVIIQMKFKLKLLKLFCTVFLDKRKKENLISHSRKKKK